ncbi:hypothetical protein GE09DRAFT_1097972 [Coniochaeta sp. 2T2.1]|nr:hypothetical protein GE09DRAFT_1097972 [Coniochaeta sp. 2T2.1]
MSTTLPVPSKVAVTAIRGLIVGTTCSLALITEDRRRRIKNAHNAIQNAEKIRSARNYHAGGAALALAIEEDAALFDPTNVPRSSSVDRWDRIRVRLEAKEQVLPMKSPGPAEPQPESTTIPKWGQDSSVPGRDEEARGRSILKPMARVKLKPPALTPSDRVLLMDRRKTSVSGAAEEKLAATSASARSPFSFPTREEIRTMVGRAASNKDRQLLDQSLGLMVQLLTVRPKGQPVDEALLDTCALLSRTCQEMGNMDGAREILRQVREFGPLAETAYYSFEPLKLLEEIVRKLEVHAERGKLHKQSIAHAVDLYCTKFVELPQIRSEQGFTIGRELMDMAFAARVLGQIEALYWRCNHHRQNDLDFTQWYILRLQQAGEHKTAIKFFTLAYSKMSPGYASVEEVGSAMVDSTLKLQGYKAAAVLRALDQICSQEQKFDAGELHSTWVMRLLEAHWECKRDIDETAALFATLNRPLNSVVKHPEAVWRVMMELAYKAGRPELAESYLQEARAANDIAWEFTGVMHYARLKAEAGDWEGVFEDVKSLKVYQDGDLADRVSRRLVELLQLYAADHTAAETDAFLRRFVTELQIPICRELVTFNATQYGTMRDSESLLAWLEYCAAQGFKVDAAFSNTILGTCRHTWKLPYRDLRTLYLKLRDLGDGFTDEYTERLMADAALSQRTSRQEWRMHIKSYEKASPLPTRQAVRAGKNYSPQDIILMMKEEMVLGRGANAVKIYRQATRANVQLPARALLLAVKAALASGDEGMETALELMRKAETRGMDVSPCTARIILAQFKQIDPALDKDARYREVQKILEDAEQKGMLISDGVLNQAALLCLKASAPRQAIKLALRAAETHRGGSPICFNSLNFSVLLQGFTWKRDLNMLTAVIAKAKSMSYWTDEDCLRTLKQALKAARDNRRPYTEAIKALQEAVEHCIEARKELKEEGLELQEGAMAIMRAAAKAQQDHGAGAFHEEMEAERQDKQRFREVEEVLLSARHEQQRSQGVESVFAPQHDDFAENGSLPSRTRRGMRWKDEMQSASEGHGSSSLGEGFLSEASGDEAEQQLFGEGTSGPDPFEAVFVSGRVS